MAGSRVIIHDGRLLAYLGRTGQSLTTFLPTDEPERNLARHALAKVLADLATTETAVFLATIDGGPPATSTLAAIMKEFDFVVTSRGLLHRRLRVDG